MKKSKILAATLTAAAIAVSCGAFAGCKDDNENNPPAPPPAETTYEITFNANGGSWANNVTTQKLTTDANGYLAAKPNPDPTREDYTFAKYTLNVDGGTEVTYGATGYKFTANTTVYAQWTEVTETKPITLDKDTLTLSIDKLEAQLTATVENGAQVEWASDNESVVLVGDTGAVEALKPGSATITATIKGTEHSATCDVLVEDAYYVIGGQDSAWNKCATFGDSNFTYFMPTDTEGVYKTDSFELAKLGNFQIAPVGDTSNDWWKKAFNGDYIATGDEVLSKNNGGNIAVQKHGKYTVTLDLTGDKAVVSGVCDEEIDDGDVETVYYLIGGMNNWTLANTVEDAGVYALTDKGDGTYSATVNLTKGQEFKIAQVGMAWNVEFAESALPRVIESSPCDCTTTLIGATGTATADTEYQLEFTSSSNIGVGVTGWYTFTLDPDAESHHQLTYTFSLTNPAE